MTPSMPEYDTVIIGSGFGGSINALRLCENGKRVLVLERGRRFRPGEFPRNVKETGNLFWQYPRLPESRGLYEVRFFSGIAAVVASGVGGGSLIYANIHIRPDEVVFDDPKWPRSINRSTLDPYYDRVAEMLSVSPLPAAINLPKRSLFHDAANRMGRPVFDPDEAVNWQGPAQHGRESCRLCTECEFGCQYGAKNTLDFTYLAQAEKLGAQILTGALVSHIEAAHPGYRVHGVDLDTGKKFQVTGKRVVVSAGTLGTNTILLRSRDIERTLPNISQKLGHGYSGNGDFLGSLQNCQADLRPWEGPDVTSVMRFFDGPAKFTLAAPTFNHAVMSVLASLGQVQAKWIRIFSPLWPQLEWLIPFLFRKGFLSQPSRFPAPRAGDPSRMTNLFAIGRDNANGRMLLKNGKLAIEWDYAAENKLLVDQMTDAMQQFAQIYRGTFAPLITWSIFRKIITVHSLGGCHLSESPANGVVSPFGEVHGYPGMFVADGSVIPTSIGFHPAMTISAISEHIADSVVGSY
ncbi:MAG: GMC family oxidoreductase [Acidobacteriaceae bacterium]|jgi:cholesterol oxidase